MDEITITVQDVVCPNCGAGEMHPNGDMLLIRGFKVHMDGHWWSQCLVCAGYYDKDLNYDAEAGRTDEGWF